MSEEQLAKSIATLDWVVSLYKSPRAATIVGGDAKLRAFVKLREAMQQKLALKKAPINTPTRKVGTLPWE